MRRLRHLVALAALLLLAVSGAAAASLTLDRSFGGDGQVVRDFWGEAGRGGVVVLEPGPEGGLYAIAGQTIARYGRDGTPDVAWARNGYLFESDFFPTALTQQSSRLLVGGTLLSSPAIRNKTVLIERRNPDGTLDRTFGGGDGVLRWKAPVGWDTMAGIAVDSAGRIVALGVRAIVDDAYVVARFGANGRPDLSFGGGDAVAVVEVPGEILCCAHPAPIAAGSSITFGGVWSDDLAVFRLTGKGAPDPAFGGGDGVATAPPLQQTVGMDIAQDGRIVATDWFGLRAARFLPNGSLDESFAGDGTSEAITDWMQTADIATLPEGEVLIGGHQNMSGSAVAKDFALARLLSNGTPDPAFGPGGVVTTDLAGGSTDQAAAMALTSAGRIVLAGETYGANPRLPLAGFASYNPSGSPDGAFGGGDGILVEPLRLPGVDEVKDLAVDPRGRLVIAGATAGRFTVGRYLRDGRVDRSFAQNGFLRLPEESAAGWRDVAEDVALDGARIFAAGRVDGSGLVISLSPDGSIDRGFGVNGQFTHEAARSLTQVVVEAGGELLAAGDDGSRAVLFETTEDGDLQTDFGEGGMVQGDTVPGAFRPLARILVVDPSTILLMRGHSVSAYTAEGEAKPFLQIGPHPFGLIGSIRAALRLQSGRILVAGVKKRAAAIARLLPSGRLDSSFGEKGIARVVVGAKSWATDLVALRDGTLILSGTSATGDLPWTRRRTGFIAAVGPSGNPRRIFARHRALVRRGSALNALTRQGRHLVAGGAVESGESRENLLLARYRSRVRRR